MKAEGQWKAGNESEKGDEGKDCGAVGCHFLPEQHLCGLAFGKEGCPIPSQLPLHLQGEGFFLEHCGPGREASLKF